MVKIINLVLYNDDNKNYVQMYQILKEHYKKYSNVTTFFYKYKNNLQNEIELDGNIINIKGEETYIPGILNKTIIALDFVQTNITDFDYIVRSNISSIIDFKLLSTELEKNEIEYYGGTKLIMNDNIPFASGTNIILSTKGVQLLIDNKDLLNTGIIDDVSISKLFNYLKIEPKKITTNKFITIPHIYNEKLFQEIMNNNYVLYRNKQSNRDIDVEQMKMITSALREK